jgi:hypothetical protein
MRHTLATNPQIVVVTEFWPHGMQAAGSSAERFFETFVALGLSAHLLETGQLARQVDLPAALAALPEFDPQHPDYCSITLVFTRNPLESA